MLWDKPIDLDEWRRRIKKMKNYYQKVEDLRKDAKKLLRDHYTISEIPDRNFFAVYPANYREYVKDERLHIQRDCLFYHIKKDGFCLMDSQKFVDEIAVKMKDKVDIELLIKDALYDADPDELMEIYERLVKNNASIRSGDGCYKFFIGGRPGRPFEFNLRS